MTETLGTITVSCMRTVHKSTCNGTHGNAFLPASNTRLILHIVCDGTEARSCHEVEWSENILCGGRHLN